MINDCQLAHQVGRSVCKLAHRRLLFRELMLNKRDDYKMFDSFVSRQAAVLLALVFTLVTLEPLHVNAVDVSFVLLEVAAVFALVDTLIAV